MNNTIITGYTGTTSFDRAAFYCPYIPLTVAFTFDWDFNKIKQSKENDQEFSFYITDFQEVFDWILYECSKDKYNVEWLDDFQKHLKVIFFDRSLAVEFKLRWFNV